MRFEASDAGHVLELPGGGRGAGRVVGVGGRLGQVDQHEDAHGQGVHADQRAPPPRPARPRTRRRVPRARPVPPPRSACRGRSTPSRGRPAPAGPGRAGAPPPAGRSVSAAARPPQARPSARRRAPPTTQAATSRAVATAAVKSPAIQCANVSSSIRMVSLKAGFSDLACSNSASDSALRPCRVSCGCQQAQRHGQPVGLLVLARAIATARRIADSPSAKRARSMVL